jgi:hypothetical protein
MKSLGEVLENKFLVVSVMGPHAGESEKDIFDRKIADIGRTGVTFWLNRSQKGRPNMVQKLCSEAESEGSDSYCIFIEPSSKGGALPAASQETAHSFSKDGLAWHSFPNGVGPVTGKVGKGAQALVFDELRIAESICSVNLWNYADYINQSLPMKIILGVSTLCAIKKDMRNHIDRIKSNHRRIIALGRICEPYCVYLR